MGEPQRLYDGHSNYIGAVRRCLQEHDVGATVTMEITSRGPRNAVLRLRPDADAFPGPVPGEAFLAWDEDNGWSLGLRREPATLRILNPVFKGLSVLPEPEDVAAWAAVWLSHPELTPSREDHPFRDHTVEDPDFEAQLASYMPGW